MLRRELDAWRQQQYAYLEVANGHQGITIATQTPVLPAQGRAIEVVRLGPCLDKVEHRHQKRRYFTVSPDHMRVDESKAIVGVEVY